MNLFVKLNSKAISPVVATSLLLVVAVISVVFFQGWFTSFSSGLITDLETQTNNFDSIEVKGVVNDKLYLSSNSDSKIELSNLVVYDNLGNEVCSFSSSDNFSSNSNLIAHWDFNSNSEIIDDKSGNNYNGELYGFSKLLLDFDNDANDKTNYGFVGNVTGATHLTSGCVSGGCYQFNGVNNYINLPPVKHNGDLSVFLWIKLNNSFSGYKTIVGHTNTSPYHGFEFAVNSNGGLSLWTGDGAGFWSDGISQNLKNNEWRFVGFVASQNVTKLYVDGVLSDTFNDKQIIGDNNLRTTIGDLSYSIPSSRNFNGTIDEVAFYSKALSGKQVKELYDNRKVKFMEFEDGVLNFDGFDNYVKVLNSENLEFKRNYSLVVNLHKPLQDSSSAIISKSFLYNNTNQLMNTSFAFDLFQSKARIFMYENVSLTAKGITDSNYTIDYSNDNYFIVATYDDNENIFTTYIDNVKIDESNEFDFSYTKNIEPLKIGARILTNSGMFYEGGMDDLRIYDKVLSLDEIKKINWEVTNLNLNKNDKTDLSLVDLSGCNLQSGFAYDVFGSSNKSTFEKKIIIN